MLSAIDVLKEKKKTIGLSCSTTNSGPGLKARKTGFK